MRMSRVLGAVGRTCISAGVLTLLFVTYQLWGTGIREAQAQNRLQDEFEEMIAGADADPAPPPTGADPAASTPPPPPEGDAIAQLRIPAIGVDKIVVEGVTLEDLKHGPGHYPETPVPGQPGNAAIAGHRTTYGAPFNRIDELEPGDEIMITTLQGSFTYEMTEQQIVAPEQVEVLQDFDDDRLTLTACHPEYSASQRIIVVARLVGPAAPGPPTTTPPPGQTDLPGEAGSADEAAQGAETIDAAGLSGEDTSAWPPVLFGLSCGLVWVAAWVLGLLWRRWPAYLVGLPFFALVLFHFFESFSRVLPANY